MESNSGPELIHGNVFPLSRWGPKHGSSRHRVRLQMTSCVSMAHLSSSRKFLQEPISLRPEFWQAPDPLQPMTGNILFAEVILFLILGPTGDLPVHQQVPQRQVSPPKLIPLWGQPLLVWICRIRKYKSCNKQLKRSISTTVKKHKKTRNDSAPSKLRSPGIMSKCRVRFRHYAMILSPPFIVQCQFKIKRSILPWMRSKPYSTEVPSVLRRMKTPLMTIPCKFQVSRIRFAVQLALYCTLPKEDCILSASFVCRITEFLLSLEGFHCPLQQPSGNIIRLIGQQGLHKQLQCLSSVLHQFYPIFCQVPSLPLEKWAYLLSTSFLFVCCSTPWIEYKDSGKVVQQEMTQFFSCQQGSLGTTNNQLRIFAESLKRRILLNCSKMCHHPTNGIRIGEAKNPGPSGFILKCCLVNPTAIFNKSDLIREIDCQIVQVAENSATAAIQIAVQEDFRQQGFNSHWSPPVASHGGVAQEEVSYRGQATGVSLHTLHPVRPSRVVVPSEIDATRVLSSIVQIGTWKIHFVTIYGYPSCHQKSKDRTNALLEAATTMIDQVNLPTIISRDFNHPLDSLAAGQTLLRSGYVHIQQKYQELYAQDMPFTCREATSPDQVSISASLQQYVDAIMVDKQKVFSDHDPVIFQLNLPIQPPMKTVWRLPQTWLTFQPDPSILEEKFEQSAVNIRLPDSTAVIT